MKAFKRIAHTAILVTVLAVVTACGSGNSAVSGPADHPSSVSLPTMDAGGEDPGGNESCKYLTREEVAAAIGPNDGGKQDYVFGGCVWSASSTKDGFREAIFAAVLPKAQYESVAEIGDPVSGFGEGATYATMHGELWFPCREGDFCGIKAHTASSDDREQIARRLATAMRGRL
ncbi:MULTISPECIES: hypothetical protein [unclassified Streptomyces]|uniref:hypothetical protein n=1 Tax=unclassified Streptomyces TaxID=2593676 RepID=UPI00382473B3